MVAAAIYLSVQRGCASASNSRLRLISITLSASRTGCKLGKVRTEPLGRGTPIWALMAALYSICRVSINSRWTLGFSSVILIFVR